ncbi:MAG TPA: hypothetical protein VFD90_03580 [Gaiellales bacterium]|nr:hypothetical protein [Gaiellales bacterium]
MGEQPQLSTFWFSDIEGSTKLVAEVGDRAFRELLREHRRIVRAAFAEYGGEEVGTEGEGWQLGPHQRDHSPRGGSSW